MRYLFSKGDYDYYEESYNFFKIKNGADNFEKIENPDYDEALSEYYR